MALDVVDQLVRSSAVDVVVVDSVAGNKRNCVCVYVCVCVCLCVCVRVCALLFAF
jgi:recA bacterial DNA recombination protein